jgi:hypothetical protein
VRAAGAPPHLLPFDHARADDLVDRGFDERGRDGLPGAPALPVVQDGRGVSGEVAVELADRLVSLPDSTPVPASVRSVVRSVVRSSMVCRARKTLPCQRNHFTRCSSWAALADVSGAHRRPLAGGVSTVIRIVRWNQPSRWSACG